MIIDTHCHYNLEPLFSGKPRHFSIKEDDKILKQNWKIHWKNAQKKGVTKSVVVGTNAKTSQVALDIASQEKNLFASIGIHPTEAENIKDLDIEIKKISSLFKNKKIVAIGEIGLDYFRLDENDKIATINKQKKLFLAQLKLAIKNDLPVIIHCRDKNIELKETPNNAYWDALEILKKYYTKAKKPFVLHCVSGPISFVLQAIDLEGYVGFDGNITYKKASEIKKILRYSPFNRILIETDAPYLPPQNHRGEICEPWMIVETAEFMESEFGIDQETLEENAEKFFNI
jgi:TatD DNase family protein